ncbi:Dynein beta chain like protein [Argiope bruennichi]|uniref:Dynein beta chain like protein n=1 Tax=Argiope bruennichi TaxID=94029 RepID=A0A8T0FE66_ARGBR|nr:Dynein beta chain like protein [Argiope bruennichi]
MNELRAELLDIEMPLVEPMLKKMDQLLLPAETSIIWSDSGVSTYLKTVEDSSETIHRQVQAAKKNLREIQDLCYAWGNNEPLLCEKTLPLDLATLKTGEFLVEETLRPMITEDGQRIHSLLQESKALFGVTNTTQEWSEYVHFVDELVSEGLLYLLRRNLYFLLQSTSPGAVQSPIFMIHVHLDTFGLRFKPPLDKPKHKTVQTLIEGIVAGIFSTTGLVKRVDDVQSTKDYMSELEELQELQEMREELSSRIQSLTREAEEVLLDLQPYSYLWKEEPDSVIKSLTANPEDTLGNVPQIIEQIRNCETLRTQIMEIVQPFRLLKEWLRVDQVHFKEHLLSCVDDWQQRFKDLVMESVCRCLYDLDAFCSDTESELGEMVPSTEQMDSSILLKVITRIQAVQDRKALTNEMFKPLAAAIKFLKIECQEELDAQVQILQQSLPDRWQHTKKLAEHWRQQISTPMAKEASCVRMQVTAFSSKQIQFREQFRKSAAFHRDCPMPAKDMLEKLRLDIQKLQEEVQELTKSGKLFEVHVPEFSQLKQCENELVLLAELWEYIDKVKVQLKVWEDTPWTQVDLDALEMQCKVYMRDIKLMDKEMRSWDNFIWLQETIKNILVALRAIHQLRNPAIKERHWTRLSNATQVPLSVTDETPLGELLSLELHRFEDVVESIVERASKELVTERILAELEATWAEIKFEHSIHQRTGYRLLHISELLIATLEDNQVQLQNLMSSKHVAHFLDRITEWVRKMSRVETVIGAWVDVQRAWSQMESIFMGSEDIKEQLPEDCERFMSIDASFKSLVEVLSTESETVVSVSDRPDVHEDLSRLQAELALCEKALASYLETKRRVFPRFYFVSSADLLDILSNGTRPRTIIRHLPKLFDSAAQLIFESEESDVAVAVISRDGEVLKLKENCPCSGAVELWLDNLLTIVRHTLKEDLSTALGSYEDGNREAWIFENIAQVALTGTQIWWTAEVSAALQRVRQGHETALKQYNKKQMQQLHHLIGLLLTDLSRESRQKVMTICTMDVHARDVVSKLVSLRVEAESDFAWQSQLRHRWEEDCRVYICDARFDYCHEYLGNTPRLVVTPLTDRCFITLTQSLKLMMGGAPTGPAGTGKTETVKDLGRALGTLVYVFNCSEQMDYRSCANIYKGLAQTGAWGCFDEFNRISVEVLSVVAVQVKCIQDALRGNKTTLCLLGDDIPLINTLGIFITMNPGYAGRTELPENLKTLFRPCAMVAPDIQLICEIMLVAEGFVEARSLGQKFTTLYSLCKQLLSKQDHYDWGLRAIKSVLVVAGSLKRSSPATPEEHILMLALRDFNLPKIVSEDVGVFMGLIGDLFPALDVPRKKNLVLEKSVRDAIVELKLQPEDSFVLKVVTITSNFYRLVYIIHDSLTLQVLQFSDLLDVRHSVFVIGAAGSGKSSVCKTLLTVHQQRGEKPLALDLNPKAVTNDELFGTINPATREWKDGLLSSLIRDLVNANTDGPRWLILDGDIDPMWIESLNSVMDDNRVLTLASRERISLTSTMRLIFEVSTLERATPATVSRGGVLYLDSGDVGWNPYVVSWIERRSVQSEKANLIIFFDKYVPPCLEAMSKRFKTVLPIPDICYVQTLCCLLECLLTPENTPPDSPNELYELYFVFCCIWAFGSGLDLNNGADGRLEFSNWFLSEFKSVKFPISGNQTSGQNGSDSPTVFDYYIDNKRFYPWSRKLQKFQPSPDVSLQNYLVPTKETHRIQYMMDLLISKGHPIMLVGPSGCGKTSVIRSTLDALDQESTYLVVNVPFNFYTSSATVQRAMELHLEKKVGKNFGPPGQKKIVYFIDDFNIPEVDMYGTCQPHTIIRQHLDYGHWYDRNKLTLKEVTNCQYLVSMCPTAGSCTINSRLQRHFCVLSVPPTTIDSMQTIFGLQLREHLRRIHPPSESQEEVEEFRITVQQQIVRLAISLQSRMSGAFHPTALKFHYVFNLRDISNVFRGLMLSSSESLVKSEDLLQLWLHESQRVYRDKLLDQDDLEKFDKILADTLKRNTEMDDQTCSAMVSNIPVHCHFAQGIGTSCYQPVSDKSQLVRLLQDALDAYNDICAPMDLVLFEDAVRHICRITRILESGGNALLVGVGGSGRQSSASLAAYICNLHLHQPTLHSEYDIQDFKADIGSLYLRAGVKNIGSLFMMSDAQVADERFLVLINDLLSSGDIPDLFPEAEVENIISALRSEVKSAGIYDSRENCWNYFINKVKRRLKVVLCFSPVGSTLRSRSRKFPTLISCTCIDWFHPWPKDALVTVCNKFLEGLPVLEPELRGSVADFVAFVYRSVNEISKSYLRKERRCVETTPKSFLQHIKTYKMLMQKRHTFLRDNIGRLEAGLQRLVDTSQQCFLKIGGCLKEQLAEQEVELQQRSSDIDALLETVVKETEVVSREKTVAAAEEAKVSRIHADVSQRQRDCEEDLARAEPALEAAQEALNTLNKSNLTELRSFGSPPVAVRNVTSAVMVLLATDGKIPKDLSWRAAKLTMSKVDNFLDSLINFDKDNIHENSLRAVQTYIKSPEFKPEVVVGKSQAAAGLCSWVINVLKYYEVYCDVEPKRKALAEANAEYNVAKEKLARIQEKVTEVESRLSDLKARCEAATEAKARCESEAQKTAFSIHLANRLLGGLASERQRWSELAADFRILMQTLPGDVLLSSAFVAYLGPFTKTYRLQLLNDYWRPFLEKKNILA